MDLQKKFVAHSYRKDNTNFALSLGVERVGYSTRTPRVIGGRVSDRITQVLGANHLSA